MTFRIPLRTFSLLLVAISPGGIYRSSESVLASDYVKTYTDVACMEAANEAALSMRFSIGLDRLRHERLSGHRASRISSALLSSMIVCAWAWACRTPERFLKINQHLDVTGLPLKCGPPVGQ
jgi:hypothetical protein